MNRKRTIWLLLSVFALLIAYDVWVAYFNTEQGDTISAVIHDLGWASRAFWLAIGILFGHWFWPLRDKRT